MKLEDLWDELEKLINNVELLLKKFGLLYYVIMLMIGDMSFIVVMIYDLEVWFLE